MTIKEYADLLGISRQAVYRRIKAKKISATTRKGHFWIEDDLVDYNQMEQNQDLAMIDALMKLFGYKKVSDNGSSSTYQLEEN